MAKDKSQLLRHIFIDRKIREGMRTGRLANCSSMAKEYEMSPKSFLRDIDYLKHQRDAPIEYDQKRRGYYYTEENYQMPAISISESDLFAVCVAEKVLKQHENTPVYKKLLSVFNKIEQSLPDKISIHPSWVDSRLSVIHDKQTRIDPEIWDIVASALNEQRSIRINYRKPGADNPTSRDVDPYHVVSFQGEWYMTAYCHEKGKILTFAVSRINKAARLNRAFSIPDEFDFEESLRNRFGIFKGDKEYRVKIRFNKECAPYVMEREWHSTQETRENKDGSVTLTLTVNHLYEIKRWILSWGSGAKVLTPKKLAENIRKELSNTLKQY